MPAGAEITALRSNIPVISEYVFSRVDENFVSRAKNMRDSGKCGFIVAGKNYGQGSSREHAALAPRHLGIRAVMALSFARIHRANLINFGILPLIFENAEDYDNLVLGAKILVNTLEFDENNRAAAEVEGLGKICFKHDLSEQEFQLVRAGGLLNFIKNRK